MYMALLSGCAIKLNRRQELVMQSAFRFSGRQQLRQIIQEELVGIQKAGTWKTERVIKTPQSSSINVAEKAHPVLNFCANNYLGLSSHAEVMEAGIEALKRRGAGLSSVRFICGTQDIHIDLEKELAKFHNRDDSILYASCFDANAGIFEVLLKEEDAIFSDELNHASIIDGIRLSKAQRHRYKHMNMEDLENQLASSSARVKMIVSDGVFSMDGDIAPLKEICDLAEQYDAVTLVDECHGTGVLGNTGRGTEEHLDIMGRIDIINNTLGKALGGAAGGYTTGPQEVVTLLRQRSRPYLFSNSVPPSVVAQAAKVVELLMSSTPLVQRLHENTQLFRSKMVKAGFQLMGSEGHPIAPILLKDAKLAAEFANEMLNEGIYVIGFSFPVVPVGLARIRVQISALHSTDDIERCVDAFTRIGKKKKVIP